MAAISTPDVVNLFKRVYGDLQNILPEDYMLAAEIPFSGKQKVGEKYLEAIVLTNENGVTFGGSSQDAFELNPSVAGAVKQAEVTPFITVLGSIVPWGVMSRAAGGTEQAFFSATKHVVKNNLRSHGKFQEITRLYGQADLMLGSVSYATATYRDVAFTTGTGTLTVNGTSVAFTNGVNTTSKHILFAPGQFAAGIWVGSEGSTIQQIIKATGVVAAEGKIVSVDTRVGVIEVDFTPVVATAVDSHIIGFKGWSDTKEMIGINKILSNTGTLFGIPTGNYSLWKGNTVALGAVKFTLGRLQDGIADAVNRGGLDGKLCCLVNPRTWATLTTTEAGLRRYDDSYKMESNNGFESIKFYSQNGIIEVKSHRYVKEGEAYCLHLPDWSRSGSAKLWPLAA